MSTRRRISSFLFGLSVPQEYVCLSKEELDRPLSFHLTTRGGSAAIDITNTHLLLGYKPVIIGLLSSGDQSNDIFKQKEFCITVVESTFEIDSGWKGFPTSARAVAKMMLQKVNTLSPQSGTIILLPATFGVHSFISGFYQWMNDLKRKIKPAKDNNIPLHGNLADQVRIAYAIPRNISVITLQTSKGDMNMFPTDLHGAVDGQRYMNSLRIGGKASQQVDAVRTIVLSDVEATRYNHVYALGKNHMKEPRSVSDFDVEQQSALLKTPLPGHTTGYRELQVRSTIDVGIHRLYLHDVLNRASLRNSPRLSHIHQYAAQWRADQGLATPSMFRS